jgi:hypothetical protein
MAETKTAPASSVFEELFQNIRKAAEANLKMQQEVLSQWSILWPGMPLPQSAWISQIQSVRKQWLETVSGLARKHREVVDRQYDAAIESLDAALHVSDADTPEELRRRTEQFCRKTLDCMREITETQIREFQEAVTKWTDLFAKAGP